ncbi:MAG TPA: G1 family glutamic endopeptidase [Gaiellaceae bacterium]
MKAAFAAIVAAFAVAAGAGNASAASTSSTNWAGYAVTGNTFSTVSGTWVQPAADCTTATSSTTASAFWVGLGGDTTSSNALEQTGTEADCLPNGRVRYSAWYELVPKASVRTSLKVSAGDRISASVSVKGTTVTLKLTNRTTDAGFTKKLTMSAPDVSSAEWIAEAPSALTPGGTSVLPLTDFGTMKFTNATAAATSGHSGTISDSAWLATRISLLSSGAIRGGPPGDEYASYDRSASEAIPTPLASSGRAFAVSFHTTSASAQTYGGI